jgi:hypothetical protein
MTMLATQPAKPGGGAADFFLESESCACLNEMCNATIPQSHVIKRIDRRTGRQEVMAVCPYCRAVYEATRVLADGRWKSIAFNMTPPEGFEPIGGTPVPRFDVPFAEQLPGPAAAATVVTPRSDDGPDASGDDADAGATAPRPTPPPDVPAVQQLDTDCDAAGARADQAAARELVLDTSTSQLIATPDPD